MPINTYQGLFIRDCSGNSYGREAILDYELSWVLQANAIGNHYSDKPRLMHQCRHILLTLINKIDRIDDESFIISKVFVWRQWKRHIDIRVNIVVEDNSEPERHSLIIENKAYTKMSHSQRDDYPNIAKIAYQKDLIWKDSIIHYCVITCHDPDDGGNKEIQKLCSGSEWKVYSFVELLDWNSDELTESDLFNEFWFTNWDTIPEHQYAMQQR